MTVKVDHNEARKKMYSDYPLFFTVRCPGNSELCRALGNKSSYCKQQFRVAGDTELQRNFNEFRCTLKFGALSNWLPPKGREKLRQRTEVQCRRELVVVFN